LVYQKEKMSGCELAKGEGKTVVLESGLGLGGWLSCNSAMVRHKSLVVLY
jgi:hypothetical protein